MSKHYTIKKFMTLFTVSLSFCALPSLAQEAIDEIQVIGRYIPDEKRSTSEIAEVLDADEISIAGDSDVAVALTRLPGLSPDSSGKYVFVRGLKERYTTTLMNGIQLPSPDPLKNAIPLDIFPTSLIGNILVQKTFSAQYPGNFGGGLIDLRTKALPDETFFNFSIGTGYNTESTGDDGLSYDGSGSDWLGYDSGSREIPKQLAIQYDFTGVTPIGREILGEAVPNVYSVDFQENEPDASVKASFGTRRETSLGSLGFVAAIDYSSQKRNKFGEQITYVVGGASNDDLEVEQSFTVDVCVGLSIPTHHCGYNRSSWDIGLNAFISTGLELNNGDTVKYTSVLLRSSQKQVERTGGSSNSIGRAFLNNTRLIWEEREVISNMIEGEHEFNLFEYAPTRLNWRGAITNSMRDVPNEKEYNYFYSPSNEIFTLSQRVDGNKTFWSYMEDEMIDYGFDLSQDLVFANREITLKGGFAINDKERDSQRLEFGFNVDNVRNNDLFQLVPEIVFGSANIFPNGIVLTNYTSLADKFNAEFENTQAYWQLDAQITDTIRISGGYRYEDSEQVVNSTDRSTAIGIEVTQEIESYLPSATFTWEFADNLQLRVGYSETINRPDSRELSPAQFIREDGRTEIGNPSLKFSEIQNLDLRYEWYFDEGDYASLGFFYKEIDNPIEYKSDTTGGDTELDVIGNSEIAKIKGIEIEVDKTIGNYFNKDFFVKANASIIDSEVIRDPTIFRDLTTLKGPLQGQSEYIANLQVGYSDEEINENFNIIFSYFDERIFRLGVGGIPDLIETPPVELGFVYSRDIQMYKDNPINLSFKIKNLLDEKPERSYGSFINETYDTGLSLSLGLKYSM